MNGDLMIELPPRDELAELRAECRLLADILRDAAAVIETIEPESDDEAVNLTAVRVNIAYALAAHDERRLNETKE